VWLPIRLFCPELFVWPGPVVSVHRDKDFQITLPAQTAKNLSSLDLPAEQWPQVGLLERPVNQDGCKGASLTLGYAADGTLQS
jgi:hypothetical protein